MARGRPGLATARRIAAGAFLFAGLFVMCFGLGNGRQAIMIAGAAITLLAIGARLATNVRRNPRQWVLGTGHVIEASEPPPTGARFGRCAIRLVVDAPGLPQEDVTVHDSRVPVALWPAPGQELPIQVAADDVRHLRVRWRRAGTATGPEDGLPAWEDQPVGSGAPGREDAAGAGHDLAGGPAPADPTHPADPIHPDDPAPDRPAAAPVAPPAPVLPGGAGGPDVPAAGDDRSAGDEIDFDLDGPPTVTIAPVPVDSPRLPRPRPSPRPRHRPEPVPAGVATSLSGGVAELVTTYPSAHPGPAGAINGVGVTMLVSDLDRSVAFYRDQLGFYEVDGGEGSTVLASGETRLVLRQAPDLGTVNRRLVHLNLEVADIEAMYAELKAGGIRFLYPPRAVSRSARLELWAAAFRDPDGHGIALTQWRPREPG